MKYNQRGQGAQSNYGQKSRRRKRSWNGDQPNEGFYREPPLQDDYRRDQGGRMDSSPEGGNGGIEYQRGGIQWSRPWDTLESPVGMRSPDDMEYTTYRGYDYPESARKDYGIDLRRARTADYGLDREARYDRGDYYSWRDQHDRVYRNQGPFKGKGPKGYIRSDERIREEINDFLAEDDQLNASEIQVTVENQEVILTGTVATKQDKRRAEDITESVSGIKNVENRIRVNHGSPEEDKQSIGITDPTTGRKKQRTDAF